MPQCSLKSVGATQTHLLSHRCCCCCGRTLRRVVVHLFNVRAPPASALAYHRASLSHYVCTRWGWWIDLSASSHNWTENVRSKRSAAFDSDDKSSARLHVILGRKTAGSQKLQTIPVATTRRSKNIKRIIKKNLVKAHFDIINSWQYPCRGLPACLHDRQEEEEEEEMAADGS